MRGRRRVKLIGAAMALAVTVMALDYGLVQMKSRFSAKQQYGLIAVLPFKFIGPEDGVYLTTGMADALISKLGRLEKLKVKPTSSILDYSDQNRDPLAAGRKLGVD